MEKLKVLYASFEAVPFIKTGGLGDVGGSLPGALKKNGCDVRVFLPKLSTIPEQYRAQMEPVAVFTVPLSWRRAYCGVEKLKYNGVTWYFIDNEQYFKRSAPYGFDDDCERMAFFCKAVLESIMHIGFMPDVIHCHDWHTALLPVFLREQYLGAPGYDRIKTVFSIHNLKFQGVFPGRTIGDVLGLDYYPSAVNQLIWGSCVNFMQGALHYSDRISTVSPTYANEICTPYFGEGLDWLLSERRSVLSGILNGIDTTEYDPATDRYIPENFDSDHLEIKAKNKEKLQAELGLRADGGTPMVTIISRLTEQKGLDLLSRILGELLDSEDFQFVVLGVGDRKYEDEFKYYASRLPERFSAQIKFDEPLSRRLYACSDILLVPSRFEPCGLSQMIAMRYGTIPVVRETGGLKDSVTPYNKYTDAGTGFGFANFNAHELLAAIRSALALYRSGSGAWQRMQKRAMSENFSWDASAKKYIELYRGLFN